MRSPLRRTALTIWLASLWLAAADSTVQGAILGPTSYVQFSDSPFSGGTFAYFYLEDFEDHLLNTPGVTGNGAVTSTTPAPNPSLIDSVDGDDGALDGSGLAGDSYFFSPGTTGITFTFSEAILGGLPTHVGIVWTDGDGITKFEAFDGNGVSLGVRFSSHADPGLYSGETAEDRFYGATNDAGISRIEITGTFGGIEVDHLQYGRVAQISAVPEPSTLLLFATGIGVVLASQTGRLRAFARNPAS